MLLAMTHSRKRWELVALACGSAFVSLIVLAVVHAVIMRAPFITIDNQALVAVHSWSSAGLNPVALIVTQFGTDWWALIVAGVVAAWKWRISRNQGLVVFAAVLGSQLLNQVFKHVFQRPRPSVAWAMEHDTSFSFPSSHAMVTLVLYGLLAYVVYRSTFSQRQRSVRVAAVVSAVAIVLAIGASRVYLGVHYPSDVVAGLPPAGYGWQPGCGPRKRCATSTRAFPKVHQASKDGAYTCSAPGIT